MAQILLNIPEGTKAALVILAGSGSVSAYCREAIEAALIRDGAMLPKPEDAQPIPVAQSHKVTYRSSLGTLEETTITATHDEIYSMFREVIKIE
jgi:hypothetical protein